LNLQPPGKRIQCLSDGANPDQMLIRNIGNVGMANKW
jgi:hypothetical protein